MSYTKTTADGGRIPLEEGGQRVNTVILTDAVDLTAEDSGKVFTMLATAGKAITVPAPALGLKYKFISGRPFATTDWTITLPTALSRGGAIVNSVFVAADLKNTINVVATAETVGDYVELYSDGNVWYVNGVAAQAGSITFTVV